jgi:hypothetical protein
MGIGNNAFWLKGYAGKIDRNICQALVFVQIADPATIPTPFSKEIATKLQL